MRERPEAQCLTRPSAEFKDNSMNTPHRNFCFALGLVGAVLFAPADGQVASKGKGEPLMIQEQGSFAVGGKIITNPGTFNPKQPTPDGQTLHGDHAYVFYQIPVNRRKLPLVFLHGTGQFPAPCHDSDECGCGPAQTAT